MAARSRLSLRSSHKGASLDESSATAAQHVPSTTKRGKRARDLLPDNDSINKPLKAPKLSTRNRVRPKVVVQVGGDDSPISALQVPTSSATHVKSEHNNSVQPNTNGSGLSGSQSTIADSQHGQQIGTSTGRMVDKRSLRSHDGGSRSKSELEQYFPNYEELVSIEPKELGKKEISPTLKFCADFRRRVSNAVYHTIHHRRAYESCYIDHSSLKTALKGGQPIDSTVINPSTYHQRLSATISARHSRPAHNQRCH